MHQSVKFCADQSSCCRDMAVFQFFFNMAAVRHLEFLKLGNFNYAYVIVLNLVPIAETVAEI